MSMLLMLALIRWTLDTIRTGRGDQRKHEGLPHEHPKGQRMAAMAAANAVQDEARSTEIGSCYGGHALAL